MVLAIPSYDPGVLTPLYSVAKCFRAIAVWRLARNLREASTIPAASQIDDDVAGRL